MINSIKVNSFRSWSYLCGLGILFSLASCNAGRHSVPEKKQHADATSKDPVSIVPAEGGLQKSAIKSIKHGTSFGNCHGYCLSETVIANDKMVITQKAWGRGKDTVSFPNKVETKPITAAEWNRLTQAVDTKNFYKLPATIGCPDCTDGGAEWIEIVQENKETYKVTFEAGHKVEGLDNLLEVLKGIK
jgi:hypothetical protein